MKRIFASLALCLLAACTTLDTPSRSAREHYEAGHRAFKTKDYKLAETEFAGAVAEYENYAEAHFALGNARYYQQKYPEAKKAYAAAIKGYGTAKTGLEALYWIGMCDYALGYAAREEKGGDAATPYFKDAVEAFSKAIRYNYTENEILGYRGYLRMYFLEFSKAQSDFRRAIRATNDPAKKKEYQEQIDDINNVFGEAARKAAEKEREESIATAKKEAAEIKDAPAAFSKAKEAWERERYAACRVYCERALELDAKHEDARKMLAKAEEYDWK